LSGARLADADPATRARAIASGGASSLSSRKEIPRQKPSSRATTCRRPSRWSYPTSRWARAVEYQRGDYDAAERLLEEGWRTAQRLSDHWLAYESLSRLVMLNLERGNADAALSRCEELEPLAQKLGEGSEVPFAATLRALARLVLRLPDAWADIDRKLDRLREIDTKGHLAYASNVVAEIDIAEGALDRGRRRAEEALRAQKPSGAAPGWRAGRSCRGSRSWRRPKTARAHIQSLRGPQKPNLRHAAATRDAILAHAIELGMSMSWGVGPKENDHGSSSSNLVRPSAHRRRA
jgi:ATP/maltotriose-dependent transcriptional regulator MalT